jgi:hypothetical protein
VTLYVNRDYALQEGLVARMVVQGDERVCAGRLGRARH